MFRSGRRKFFDTDILCLADAWRPSSKEEVSHLAREEYVQLLLFALMAEPCLDASQLPKFEERLEWVPSYADETVETSPLFKEYRETKRRIREAAEREAAARKAAGEAARKLAEVEAERKRKDARKKATDELHAVRQELEALLVYLKDFSYPCASYEVYKKYNSKREELLKASSRRLRETSGSSDEDWTAWARAQTEEIKAFLQEARAAKEKDRTEAAVRNREAEKAKKAKRLVDEKKAREARDAAQKRRYRWAFCLTLFFAPVLMAFGYYLGIRSDYHTLSVILGSVGLILFILLPGLWEECFD